MLLAVREYNAGYGKANVIGRQRLCFPNQAITLLET